MQTFLLTWNPNRWPEDRLAAVARSFQAGRRRVTSWSVGGRQRGIEKGDRLFLLRQSSEPKGIIASGWAVEGVYPGRHWDAPRRRGKATYVDLAIEALFVPGEEAPLALELLRREVPRGATWNAQSSGTVIEPQAAARIETLWARHLRRLHVEPRPRPQGKLPARPVAPELQGLEGRETRLMVRHLHREQWLRDEKIQEALRLGGGRLRCEVPSCGFAR